MGTFLVVWILCSGLTMVIREKPGVDLNAWYYFKSILIGFLITIPIMILYGIYLASTVLGSGVWVLALGLLVFGAFKLLFLIFGIGGGSSESSSISRSWEDSQKSTLYHAQVFRHGQWINLGGYYHLSSAYDQAERYAGKGERTRVVDSDGRVQ